MMSGRHYQLEYIKDNTPLSSSNFDCTYYLTYQTILHSTTEEQQLSLTSLALRTLMSKIPNKFENSSVEN